MLAVLLSVFQSCSDRIDDEIVEEETPIEQGESVQFSMMLPNDTKTRGAKADYENLIDSFKVVQAPYDFTIAMYENGTSNPIATAGYLPITSGEGSNIVYDNYGFLKQKNDNHALYWESNVKKYGFLAWANKNLDESGNLILDRDQTDKDKLFAQDYVEGYGYVPGWIASTEDGATEQDGAPALNLDALNYLTSKEWYKMNQSRGSVPEGFTNEYYKRIPLYLQHKRAKITVILRGGEGVNRDLLTYDPENGDLTAKQYVKTDIISYK